MKGLVNSLWVSVFTCTDEIMQQEIRPLVAVDIIEQLHRQFAILSGKDGVSVVFLESFANVLSFAPLISPHLPSSALQLQQPF